MKSEIICVLLKSSPREPDAKWVSLSSLAGLTLTGLRLVVMMILCRGPANTGGSLGSLSRPCGLV